ncbi:hypothetical protein N665_0641s0005, partial [Sinapis alba]
LRFSEKHFRNAPKQPLVLMLKEYRVFRSVDLNFVPPSVEFSDALSLKDCHISEDNHIDTVSHCDGLLLCNTLEDELVVLNPCSGETRWIRDNDGSRIQKTTNLAAPQNFEFYKTNHDYHQNKEFEIYDFNSNTWKVLNARIGARNCISKESHGVTLKGNTYWVSSDNKETGLLSFDFMRERCKRSCFPLTFKHCIYGALSVVGEELSVLCYKSSKMEIDLIGEDMKVALCDSSSWGVEFTIGEEDEYYSEIPFEGTRFRHEHIFKYVLSLVRFQKIIESNGFGKCHCRRWWDHRRRHGYEEIESTDFSSRCGSRGYGRTTRCVTL